MKVSYPYRSIFIPSKGKRFLAMDLSQAETWIVAYSANEPKMKDALINGDIHRLTASVFYNKPESEIIKTERYGGKQGNHALSYREGPFQLQKSYNKNGYSMGLSISIQIAKKYHAQWHGFYNVKNWWYEIEQKLRSDRTLETTYGRKRVFYGWLNDELFKEGTAFIPQSTVGDHALGATHPELGIMGGILGIHRWCRESAPECKIVHTAHDSVMLEVPCGREYEIAGTIYPMFKRPIIVNQQQFTIPADVEIGERWGELEKVKMQ